MMLSSADKGSRPMTQTLIPYLTVDDAAAALEFYARAFGARETLRLKIGDKVGHAEMDIGGARLMLSGEWPQMGMLGPKARGGASTALSIMVADADAAYARAIEAGATAIRPPTDEFYGDRVGMLLDPFGHRWSVHQHNADYAPEELQSRMDDAMSAMRSGAEAEVEAHPS